ncbi:MAG: DNA mismatch endonuclease Vsr [Pseudomonadales bacterium]|nr:DNA mismatch endonuclease Vsr [Pseudomonadales bacterium]
MTSRPSDERTTRTRSKLMKKVRQKHTSAEMSVRRHLHSDGFRYRLHPSSLPGTPDVVLPRYRTAIFVNGCFWHGHDCKHGSTKPKTNTAFWERKIEGNRMRDARKTALLQSIGWNVIVIWECQVADPSQLSALSARIRTSQKAGERQ